ncbi:MAG: acyP [Frankiales bacterium]|jgi:acylphosphatase|nr:acyP [Frankiales bacterium]
MAPVEAAVTHAPTLRSVSSTPVRVTAFVKGRVQGVGFRWWTRARALELGLVGSATNLDDGRVQVVAEGPEPALHALLDLLRGGGTPGRVDFVAERWGQARGEEDGFAER